MYWEKKICIRLTLRRIIGALLVASVVANLIIVGAVFGADSAQVPPTPTSTWTSHPWTATFSVVTSTVGESPTATQTVTVTQTLEPTSTDTPTATQTPTNTDQPTATLCVMRFDWPMYRVRRGDTLFSIALATGSTVQELVWANCLKSDRIFAGQVLYVPRLLINTFTPTPIATQTNTPTSGTPIGFQNPSVCLGSSNNTNLYLAFAVSLSNAQDVRSVTAISGQSIVVPLQDTGGSVYSGAVIGSGGYSPGMVVPYYFAIQDRFGQSIRSDDYSSSLIACGPILRVR